MKIEVGDKLIWGIDGNYIYTVEEIDLSRDGSQVKLSWREPLTDLEKTLWHYKYDWYTESIRNGCITIVGRYDFKPKECINYYILSEDCVVVENHTDTHRDSKLKHYFI